MHIQKVILLLASTVMLTACGVTAEQKVNVAKVAANITTPQVEMRKFDPLDPVVEFEKEYDDIVSSELKSHFKNFSKYGSIYLDSSDMNNIRYVVNVDDEDANEMIAFKQSIKEKMGDRIEFRKSKYSYLRVQQVNMEIRKIIEANGVHAIYGVSVWDGNHVDIKAANNISDNVIKQIEAYGDQVKLELVPPEETIMVNY